MIRKDAPEDAYAELTDAMRSDLLDGLVIMHRRSGTARIAFAMDSVGSGAWVSDGIGGCMWMSGEQVTGLRTGGFVDDRCRPLPRLRTALDFASAVGTLREL